MGTTRSGAGADPLPHAPVDRARCAAPVKAGNGNGMTIKQFVIAMTVISGLNYWVASSLLPQSEVRTRELIDQQLKSLVLDRIDRLATHDQVRSLGDRINRLEQRMDARLKALENK